MAKLHWQTRLKLGAACAGLGIVSPLFAGTSASWLTATSGDWTDATKWSTDPSFPNNGAPASDDTYDVVVDAIGSNYALTVNAESASGGKISVDSFELNASTATVSLTTGTLSVLSPLVINSGKFRLAGGTLGQTSLGGNGGHVEFSTGYLDQLTLLRDAAVVVNNYATLSVRNGLTLSGGNLTMAAGNTGISFIGGNQTLGGAGTFSARHFSVTGGILTIGSGITVNGSGQLTYANAGVNNYGLVRANDPSSRFYFSKFSGSGMFTNYGVLEASDGAEMAIEGQLDNSNGILRANGGGIYVGDASSGSLGVVTSRLGTRQSFNGGVIGLRGPVDNTNYTLAVDDTTGDLDIGGANITGGRLETSGGGKFFSIANTILNDVVLAGRLTIQKGNISNSSDTRAYNLTVDGGTIVLQGTAAGSSPNAALLLYGNHGFAGAGELIYDGNTDNNMLSVEGVLTTGPDFTIRTGTGGGIVGTLNNGGKVLAQTTGRTLKFSTTTNNGLIEATNGSTAQFASPVVNHGTISGHSGGILRFQSTLISDGTISAGAGSVLNMDGSWSNAGQIVVTDASLVTSGTWSNTGSIVTTNSTVSLGGTITWGGTFLRTGGTVAITGTLNNTATPLALNAGSGSWNLTAGGKIFGGAITTSDGVKLNGDGGTIDSVTNYGEIAVLPSRTLSVINSVNSGEIVALGAGAISVTGGGSNAGLISVSSAVLNVAGAWENSDSVTATDSSVTLSGGWKNTGSISTAGGTLSLAGAWSNTSTISTTAGTTVSLGGTPTVIGSLWFTDSTVNITGSYTPAQLETVDRVNSPLSLATGGNVLNQNGSLMLSATLPLQLKGGKITGGSLGAAAGYEPVLQGSSLTLDGVSLETTLTAPVGSSLVMSGSWDNNGVIVADNATVSLGGTFTTEKIGVLVRSGSGAVRITGALDNVGQTFTVDSIGSWQLAGGMVTGGTIASLNGAALENISSNSVLNGVSLSTNVNLQTALNVQNGLTLLDSTLTFNNTTGSPLLNFNGAQTLGGSGAVVFGGAFNGTIRPGGGTLTVGSGITIFTSTRGGTVGASGVSTINQGLISSRTAGQTITFAGDFTNQGTIEAINGGLLRLATNPAATFTNAGVLSTMGTSNFVLSSPLTWTGGSIVGTGFVNAAAGVSITADVIKQGTAVMRVGGSGLSISAGKKLDLTEGKLIITGARLGSWNGSAYTLVTGLVAMGRNGGVWNGPGITTSMSDATSGSGYTMLGTASGSQVKGIGTTQTSLWSGHTVTGSDTLVMYTYGGDANLSGFVDIDDYGLIDFNASTGGALTGWYNGDFDYNGLQDIDDYGIIDFVINIQGPPFSTGSGLTIAAIPEPSAACGLALLTTVLASRRRRLRSSS